MKRWILGVLACFAAAQAWADGAVSPYAYELTRIPVTENFSIPITNSMVMMWGVSLVLIVVIRLMARKAALVPGRGQSVVEMIIEGVSGLIEPIVGKRLVRPTFWLLSGFFVVILIHNWSSLLPGVGTFGTMDEDGHFRYWMRPANADLNTTLALAAIAQVAWFYYVVRYAGLGFLLKDLFGNKADKKEVPRLIYIFLFPIFFFVGMIEMVSIAFRLVSLSFRLFGNVFGGENLIVNMMNMVPWVLPVPFYLLELLIGVIQATVFTLLVSVYIGLICNHESEEGHAH
ncbi:MAG: ATP synthase subunit a [Verrucomicrobia bacterium ADurb.Bin474]|nr:MAG: ATP synthase subunit a [Verrucomicrobia bacterium ADurb.Bin474]